MTGQIGSGLGEVMESNDVPMGGAVDGAGAQNLLSCFFGVERSGFGWAHRPDLYGPTAAKRPASKRKSILSGQAEGSRMRIRATPSLTRAAILIRRRRRVANSATAQGEAAGAAARRLCSSQ